MATTQADDRPAAAPAAKPFEWEALLSQGHLQTSLVRRAVRITLFYAVFAAIWIYLSDEVARRLADDLHEVVSHIVRHVGVPCVVDADALNLLVDRLEILATTPAVRVLTPHPGEFARLTGLTTTAVQANRESLAIEFAQKHRVVLVLKGAGTIVTDGLRVFINRTGNPGMATGGTGDVLTGLITALIAQGADPFDAACLGCHLHGLAGDIAAEELSPPGMIASDLPRYLPRAWKRT